MKAMRVLACSASFAGFLTVAVGAEAYTVSLTGGLSAPPGGMVTVAVAIDDGGGLSAAQFSVGYQAVGSPKVLQYVGAGLGTLNPHWGLEPYDDGSSVTVVTWGIDDLATGSGTLASLTFTVLPGVAPGTSTGLSLMVTDLGGSAGSVPANEITALGAEVTVVPLPGALVLFATAMVAGAALGRRPRGRSRAIA